MSNSEQLAETGGLIAASGIAGWVLNQIWRWVTRRDQRLDANMARKDRLDEHTSTVAIELLRLTQASADALNQRLMELQAQVGIVPELERQVAYLKESLIHVGALLDAPDGPEREAAEYNGRAFLIRMKRLTEDQGLAANLEQRERARRSLTERGML